MWWLLACACPTFEELEVVDLTERGDPDALREVRDAVADFARFTAREGVCVAEVAVVDTIEHESPVGNDSVEAAGVFATATETISIAPVDFPLWKTVDHELCHALDWHEELHEARPDLFTGTDIDFPDEYPTDFYKRAESFADACEVPIADAGLELAFEEMCGVELLGPLSRYLTEVVYPGTRAITVSAPVALRKRALTLGLPAGGTVEAIVGTATDLHALVQEASERIPGHYPLTLYRLDPDTGALRARLPLDRPVGYWHGTLLPGDEDPVLLTWNTRREEPVADVHVVRGDTIVPLGYTLPEPWEIGGAAADGLLVGTTEYTQTVVTGETWLFGGVRAWDLGTGAEVALDFPADAWGTSVWAEGFLPGPDGLEMITWDGYARLDAAAGTWSLGPSPYVLRGLLRIGDARLHVYRMNDTYHWAVHDLEADTWALADTACEADVGTLGAVQYAQVGERAFVLPHPYPGAEGLEAWEIVLD